MKRIVQYTRTTVWVKGYDLNEISLLACCYNELEFKRSVTSASAVFLNFPTEDHALNFIEAVKALP
jgi:hypothetical protein